MDVVIVSSTPLRIHHDHNVFAASTLSSFANTGYIKNILYIRHFRFHFLCVQDDLTDRLKSHFGTNDEFTAAISYVQNKVEK